MFGFPIHHAEDVQCRICKTSSKKISRAIGVCAHCLKKRPEKALPIASAAHKKSRSRFSLPASPPTDTDGIKCKICANQCRISSGKNGFCGLRTNEDGHIKHIAGRPSMGIVESYYDALPTNCVAEWVCPGGTGSGYPQYSYSESGPERGWNNLAVFYGACTFDCLFCQNWHYRLNAKNLAPKMSAAELASKVSVDTSCICHFGGDPTAQIPHAIAASRIAKKNNPDRILRICWETNGTMNAPYMKAAAHLSLKSGGCIKIDVKAWDESLYHAMCGVSNKQTVENLELLARYGEKRREPPLLVVSTLLVPGYVDAIEVSEIAKFLASLDPSIPYSLLAFHPDFEMIDMPITSRKEAQECYEAAKKAGLTRVNIGNAHLLG